MLVPIASNPFEHQQTVTGPRFLNRTRELAAFRRAIDNGTNILLIAPRRLGKSSLLREVLRRLPKSRVWGLYVDVLPSRDEGDVAQRVLNALARTAFGRARRGWLWLLEQFKSHRPALTVDPQTGMPMITLASVDAGLPDLERTLHVLEATAASKRRRIVVVFDEFQKILERDKDGRIVATLRSVIQHQRRVSYIFSGSKRHALLGLVEDRNQPFWGQLDLRELTGIPIQEFAPSAKRAFAAARRPISTAVLDCVGTLCGDNPKRIQELLYGLYETGERPTLDLAAAVLRSQVLAREHHLEDILDDVEEGPQKRLLVALARSGPGQRIFGRAFVTDHRLGTPDAAQKGAKALRKKGILNEANWFTDPYLAHYLRFA